MEFNFDAIHAFSVFSESMNFTQAAKKLSISQPALHVKVNKLASQLRVELYRKHGGQLLITEHGKKVVKFANEMMAQSRRFMAELHDSDEPEQIKLAAGQGSYLYLLGDAIKKINQDSSVSIQLFTADSETTIELLELGKVDLGVTVLKSPHPKLHSKQISTVRAKLVAHKGHELAGHKEIGLSQLKRYRLVAPSANKPHRVMIENLFEAKGIQLDVAVEADGWELTKHFVKLGLGVAIVNGSVAITAPLVGIPIRDFPPSRYFLLCRRLKDLGPAARKFYAEVAKPTG